MYDIQNKLCYEHTKQYLSVVGELAVGCLMHAKDMCLLLPIYLLVGYVEDIIVSWELLW